MARDTELNYMQHGAGKLEGMCRRYEKSLTIVAERQQAAS